MTELEHLAELIKKHKPYLLQIDEEVEGLSDGVINLEIRVFKGFVTDLVVINQKKYIYKKPPNGIDNTSNPSL